jgi:hypothetical protein
MSCDACGGTGYTIVERGEITAARKCGCRVKAEAERAAQQARVNTGSPMNADVAAGAVRGLAAMGGFFPPERDAEARAVIGDLLLRMCGTAEQCQMLVRKAVQLYSGAGGWEKCGMVGLRQILSAVTVPKDGVVLHTGSEMFPGGLPRRATGGPPLLLPPPDAVQGEPILMPERPRGYSSLLPAALCVPPELAQALDAGDVLERAKSPKVEPMSEARRAEWKAKFEEAEKKRRSATG